MSPSLSPSHDYTRVPCQGLNLPCDPPSRPAVSTSPTLPHPAKCGCWCCSTLPRREYSWASSPTTRAASSTASGKSSPTTSRSSSTERWVETGGGNGAGGKKGRFQCGLWSGRPKVGDHEEALSRSTGELMCIVYCIKVHCYWHFI